MLKAWQVVVLTALALLTLGVVMVNSASMEIVPKRSSASAAQPDPTPVAAQGDPLLSVDPSRPARAHTFAEIVTSQPAKFMVIALAAMGLGALVPVRGLAGLIGGREHEGGSRWSGMLVLAVGVVLILGVVALVYLPGLGREIKGAERWLRVGVPGLGRVSVQPSEIAKWAMLGVLAWYAAAAGARLGGFWAGLVPGLLGLGLVVALIVKEDLGTGALILMTGSLVLIAGGAKIWHFAALAPVGAAGVAAAIVTSEYRMQRVRTFLNDEGPFADPRGAGYHVVQSLEAVSGGGLTGRGLGYGIQKFGYLPEDTNDFIFAIICEELGAAGAAVVVSLFAALIVALSVIAVREPSRLLKLYVIGVVSTIGIQALINMAVVTALGPTKGIALPLVSAGGTGWTLTCLSLGVVVSIARTQGRAEVSVFEGRGTVVTAS
ncbi:MAG: FtsW/RodA/SpoVE family cell cycle protein [Phycisphaeraceae bacterium]|nr:MAG: FtsW/RodA/SpoVE family cell cycle protein [Phycisphaeraceae bacterium]